MTRAVVLQHIRCEPPGVFTDVLRERGVGILAAELDDGDDLPLLEPDDLLLVMGGPMGVNDESDHPWLAAEKRFIGEAVGAGTPYFGVCLGAQLLAASLGAAVRRGPRPEVGVLHVSLTAEAASDPVFKSFSDETPVLQWHGDTFDLPAGAVRLASSAITVEQGFRYGSLAYGLQFHLEVTAAVVDAMLEGADAQLAAARTTSDVIRSGTRELSAGLEAHARTVFGRWIRLVGARP